MSGLVRTEEARKINRKGSGLVRRLGGIMERWVLDIFAVWYRQLLKLQFPFLHVLSIKELKFYSYSVRMCSWTLAKLHDSFTTMEPNIYDIIWILLAHFVKILNIKKIYTFIMMKIFLLKRHEMINVYQLS